MTTRLAPWCVIVCCVAVQGRGVAEEIALQRPQEPPPTELAIAGIGPDHGADLDGDGLFDYLEVPVRLRIPAGQQYLISFHLEPQGESGITSYPKLASSSAQVLEIGERVVQARFDGPELHQSFHDGPYRFQVTIRPASAGPPDGSPAIEQVYVTRAYTRRQFAPRETFCVVDGVVLSDLSLCPPPPVERTDGR